MKIENNGLFTSITADEGMLLTDGETYTDNVALGKNDSVDNWREIPADERPLEEGEQV